MEDFDVEETSDKHRTKYAVFVPPEFFEKVGKKEGNENVTMYRCKMGCTKEFQRDGKEKLFAVPNTSLYNLRRHIKAYHSARLQEFNTAFKRAKLGESSKVENASGSQMTIDRFVRPDFLAPVSQIRTQEDLDDRILNYIIRCMLPLREVEKAEFRELIGSLAGKLEIKGRTFFTEKLKKQYSQVKTRLIQALSEAKYVSTTADLWSSHRRSFLGMTVHWIGEDLVRRSAVLAVRRVMGSHTHDVVAKVMWQIHKEFSIVSKVHATITDNGSNFLKSFKIFGNHQVEAVEGEDDDIDDEEDDDGCVFISIDEIFDQEAVRQIETSARVAEDDLRTCTGRNSDSEDEEERIILPRHLRCACHTLNLIATTEINNITNMVFNSKRKKVETKLQVVWNKQSRSSLQSDFIKQKLEKLFVIHNATRWNSFYDALSRVNFFIKTKPYELKSVLEAFHLKEFTDTNKQYIAEYVEIMEPFSEALDVLQNEERMSLGCLLPTIALLKKKFEDFSNDYSIIHCQPLILAVLRGLDTRFRSMFEDPHLRLASISDPNFKTIWVEDSERVSDDVLLLRDAVQRKKNAADRIETAELSADGTPLSRESPKRKKRFLDGYRAKRASKESDEVDRYLNEPTGVVADLERFPFIKQVYMSVSSYSLPLFTTIQYFIQGMLELDQKFKTLHEFAKWQRTKMPYA